MAGGRWMFWDPDAPAQQGPPPMAPAYGPPPPAPAPQAPAPSYYPPPQPTPPAGGGHWEWNGGSGYYDDGYGRQQFGAPFRGRGRGGRGRGDGGPPRRPYNNWSDNTYPGPKDHKAAYNRGRGGLHGGGRGRREEWGQQQQQHRQESQTAQRRPSDGDATGSLHQGNMPTVPPSDETGPWKKLCISAALGVRCDTGQSCPYSHAKRSERPCKKWHSGGVCKRGNTCFMGHEEASETWSRFYGRPKNGARVGQAAPMEVDQVAQGDGGASKLGAPAPPQDYQAIAARNEGGTLHSLLDEQMRQNRALQDTLANLAKLIPLQVQSAQTQDLTAQLQQLVVQPLGATTAADPSAAQAVMGGNQDPLTQPAIIRDLGTANVIRVAERRAEQTGDDFLLNSNVPTGANAGYGEPLEELDAEFFPFGFAPQLETPQDSLVQQTDSELSSLNALQVSQLDLTQTIGILKAMYTPPLEFGMMHTFDIFNNRPKTATSESVPTLQSLGLEPAVNIQHRFFVECYMKFPAVPGFCSNEHFTPVSYWLDQPVGPAHPPRALILKKSSKKMMQLFLEASKSFGNQQPKLGLKSKRLVHPVTSSCR